MLGLKERYKSLDGLDVSTDGVDLPIFSPKHISLVELVTVMRINAFYLLTSPLGPLDAPGVY